MSHAPRKPRGRQRLDVTPAGSGLILVDKPQGLTSHDVVSRARRLAATRRVGHGGTLDPMATGLLVLGVNGGTKLLQYVTGLPKTYLATMRLGMTTTTDDAEGETVATLGVSGLTQRSHATTGAGARTEGVEGANENAHVDTHAGTHDGTRADTSAGTHADTHVEAVVANALDTLLPNYRGDILQVPTTVSAIKVDGKRAYALAREGKDVELAARPVTIFRFEVVREPRAVHTPEGLMVDVDVAVECSSGTYIRALARDIGRDLGVGGHLTALRRTTTGAWSVDQASTLESLTVLAEAGGPVPLMGMAEACRTLFSSLTITGESAARFAHGQAPHAKDVLELKRNDRANPKFADIHAVWTPERPDQVLGLVRVEEGATLRVKTVTVFPEGSK